MPDKKFDLGSYVEVKDRIAKFYELFGQGRLVTGEVRLTSEPDGTPRVMVQGLAYRSPEDLHPGVGWSWMELPGKTTYTKGSELENTETSAWGRAIGSLGILIDHSIASGQEVQNKQDDRPRNHTGHRDGNPGAASDRPAEQRTTHRDGLIGKAIAQGTQDFQLRQGPDGPVLPFRIKEGRLSQIAVAKGPIAVALDTYRDEVLGNRVTVWGRYEDQTFPKGDTDITYKVLHVERIKTPAFEMPSQEPDFCPECGGQYSDLPGHREHAHSVEPDTIPVWEPLDEEERKLVAGGLPE